MNHAELGGPVQDAIGLILASDDPALPPSEPARLALILALSASLLAQGGTSPEVVTLIASRSARVAFYRERDIERDALSLLEARGPGSVYYF